MSHHARTTAGWCEIETMLFDAWEWDRQRDEYSPFLNERDHTQHNNIQKPNTYFHKNMEECN